MILVNLLEPNNEANARNPLLRVRLLALLMLPVFVLLASLATLPTAQTVVERTASLEEKESLIQGLGRLPGYYTDFEKISAHVIDELVFDRVEIMVREQESPMVEFREDGVTVSLGYLNSDPRVQAQLLAAGLAPHQKESKLRSAEIAVSLE